MIRFKFFSIVLGGALILLNGCIFDSKPSQVTSSVVYDQSLSTKSNPLDIAFVSDTKAFVATENIPYILILNPENGKVTDSISTSTYIYNPPAGTGTIAGSPFATDLAVYKDTLYVMMNQRTIDMYPVYGQGLVLMVNKNTNSVIDTILLSYANPTSMTIIDNKLYITSCGGYAELTDGAVEMVDLDRRLHLPNAISKSTLGGRPERIVQKSGDRFYVETYVEWNDVKVLEADFAQGIVTDTLPNIVSAYGGIFYDSLGSRLYVGESKTGIAGLKIFNTSTNTQIDSTIKHSSGLWPMSFASWSALGSNGSKKLFIAHGNYVTGILSWIDQNLPSLGGGSLAIGGDCRLFVRGSFLYILEGLGADNIKKIDCQKFIDGN